MENKEELWFSLFILSSASVCGIVRRILRTTRVCPRSYRITLAMSHENGMRYRTSVMWSWLGAINPHVLLLQAPMQCAVAMRSVARTLRSRVDLADTKEFTYAHNVIISFSDRPRSSIGSS